MDVARLISLVRTLFSGVIVGAIPAVWGIKREQKILAIAGFSLALWLISYWVDCCQSPYAPCFFV